MKLKVEYEAVLRGHKEGADAETKKDTWSRLDLLVTRKGFDALPKFSGKAEAYEDWKFQIEMFIGFEEGFTVLFEWIETMKDMPTLKGLYGEDLQQSQHPTIKNAYDLKRMNEQLYNFLCLNLQGDALTTAKSMKKAVDCNGIACYWKFFNDCQAVTGQRIQNLANAIYKPGRVKKYGEVQAAMEKWKETW
jgi:hypothetical protein